MRLILQVFFCFFGVVIADMNFATEEQKLELILNEDSLKNFEGSEISLEDGLYCPGIEGCPMCCPLGHVRDIAGCFTCECRKNGLFAEDIIVTENEYDSFFMNYGFDDCEAAGEEVPQTDAEVPRRSKRAANKPNHNLWKRAPRSSFVKIPFYVDFMLHKGIKELISDVVSILNAKTCIRLVRRTGEHDFVHFYDGGSRLCASHVGKAGGPQKIYLGERCMHKGTVAHELMHALGFDHEQSRPDRDQYIKIFWSNIRRGMHVNFAKKNKNHWYAYDSNYDVDSVMHYSSKQAGTRKGGPTIKTKDGKWISRKNGFSLNDLLQINRMYNCPKYYENAVRLEMDNNFCADVDKDCESKKHLCTSEDHIEMMKDKCRGTCKFCHIDHFTTEAPVTKKAVETADCRDTLKICKSWAKYNYCEDGRFKVVALTKCPFSCGVCGVTTTTLKTTTTTALTTTTTPRTGCYDVKSNCDTLKRRGYCKLKKYTTYVTYYCKLTCDRCASSTTTTTYKPKAVKTTPKPNSDLTCIDKTKNCKSWAKKGFCKNIKYRTYMLKSCRISCGLCRAPTTLKTTTTTTKTTTPPTTVATTSTTSTQQLSTLSSTSMTPTTQSTAKTELTSTTKRIKETTSKKRTTKPKITSTKPTTTTTKQTTSTTRKPFVKVCKDKLRTCKKYFQRGLCRVGHSRAYFLINCKKSCGVCK